MNEQALAAEIAAAWTLQRTRGDLPPRLNLRLVFGDEQVAAQTRQRLEPRSDERCWYVVRSSGDHDAVRLRNGRPEGAPASASIVFLLFWCPGSSAHDKNAQSLSDLQPIDVADVLAHPAEFELEAERLVQAQCRSAALAWEPQHQARATEHLLAAFHALRACLRTRCGGRQRSVPFVTNLTAYARYLDEIVLPIAEFEATPPAERAALMLRRWGERLTVFGLFMLPALASVLGVRTDPSKPVEPRSRTGEKDWTNDLVEVLADNLEQAMDHPRLGDLLAGKSTLRERLERGAQVVPLCSNPTANAQAVQALLDFCEQGDPSALGRVEWLFYKDPSTRRSASLGLRGLLLSLGKRNPRRDPLEVAYDNTLAFLQGFFPNSAADAEALRAWAASLRERVSRAPASAVDVARVLAALVEGTVPEDELVGLARPQLDTVAAQASKEQHERLIKLSRDWERLAPSDDADDTVEAPSLLLGLARLLLSAAKNDSDESAPRLLFKDAQPQDQLRLSLVDVEQDVSLLLPFSGWGPPELERLSVWLRDDVRASLFQTETKPDEEDEEEDEEQVVKIHVEHVHGSKKISVGGLHLTWKPRARLAVRQGLTDSLKSWSAAVAADRRKLVVRVAELLQTSQEPRLEAQSEAPQGTSLPQRWSALYRAEKRGTGSDVVALLAPVSQAAQAWVEAWHQALADQGASAQRRPAARSAEELMRLMQEALTSQNMAAVAQLSVELAASQPQGAVSLSPQTIDATRTLLRLGTLSLSHGEVRAHVVLTPYHPLVLHLRVLSDRMLAQCIRTLLLDGWPAVAVGDLEKWLDDWGLPAPAQTYGFWEGSPPLAFDGWLDGPLALFSPHDSDLEVDAGVLGTQEVAGVLKRYSQLHSASGDRLHLRMLGDDEGVWASRVLVRRLADPEDGASFATDVDLVTSLPARELSAVEREAFASTDLLAAFEPGPDGTPPRVRVRRLVAAGQTDPKPRHLSLVVGEQIREFRPTCVAAAAPPAGARPGLWEPSALLLESTPELSGYQLSTGEREDEMGQTFGFAVGLACGAPRSLFRHSFSFDPTRCVAPLRQHQGNAHWLVLASRQPIYRALQAAGAELTTLLDFFSTTERGRPLYVCVGLNARNDAQDRRRLAASLRALLGPSSGGQATPEELAHALIKTALRLAPGLAMQCIGATSLTHLEGLVGLLLTAQAVQQQRPDALLLSLDQHASLLDDRVRLGRGRGSVARATRADLLAIWQEGDRIVLSPFESKFTTQPPNQVDALVKKALAQITETTRKLAYLTVAHPLSLRSRRRLLLAVVRQAHLLGDKTPAQLDRARALAGALERPQTELELRPSVPDAIHVWSLAAAPSSVVGLQAVVHDRGQTLGALRTLG